MVTNIQQQQQQLLGEKNYIILHDSNFRLLNKNFLTYNMSYCCDVINAICGCLEGMCSYLLAYVLFI